MSSVPATSCLELIAQALAALERILDGYIGTPDAEPTARRVLSEVPLPGCCLHSCD